MVMAEKLNKGNGVPFTHKDAQVFRDRFDVLEGVYGNEAKGYCQQYLRLWPQYQRLKHRAIKVRLSPLRTGHKPLLIIDR